MKLDARYMPELIKDLQVSLNGDDISDICYAADNVNDYADCLIKRDGRLMRKRRYGFVEFHYKSLDAVRRIQEFEECYYRYWLVAICGYAVKNIKLNVNRLLPRGEMQRIRKMLIRLRKEN